MCNSFCSVTGTAINGATGIQRDFTSDAVVAPFEAPQLLWIAAVGLHIIKFVNTQAVCADLCKHSVIF